MLGYLADADRRALGEVIAEAGRRASTTAPLAVLSLEPVGDRFEVRLRGWPGGGDRLLALADGHGLPVRWVAGVP
ncbi:hypothetical protein SAMN05421810_106197 [Amycolatopsis arida]|uniref:Uncharacterized protein n=1 Tax=Amycolatopsis arida TaxID=587909 RepID=A0A1I5XQG9_9PSEU|nr:uncharacterized protein DUF2332 [Amycolatopsis arida]SFQ34076.1 hypothetical protein SAMN05421810_106197 [Amycolatopsis arida]